MRLRTEVVVVVVVAQGSLFKRATQWFDWMLPEAWNIEHNNLHHYRLGEKYDPDLVERNREWADLLILRLLVWGEGQRRGLPACEPPFMLFALMDNACLPL
jgi:hypothetical protein